MQDTHEYRTARSVFGFVEFLAWAFIVLGAIIAVAGFAAGSKVSGFGGGGGFLAGAMGALPGIGMIALGLIIVVIAQVAKASVDTSERVGRLIQINRDGFQYLKSQSAELPESFDFKANPVSAQAAPPPQTLEPQTIPYESHEVVVDEAGKIWVGEQDFLSIEIAKRYIDHNKSMLDRNLSEGHGLNSTDLSAARQPIQSQPDPADSAVAPVKLTSPAPTPIEAKQ